MIRKRARDSSLFYINFFHWKGGIEMEEKEVVVEETTNEEVEELEVQTTFNEDGIDILVEDGEVENEYKND